MSIEKRLIALLSLRASEFNNIIVYVHSVMHKSGTKYLQSFVAFKRDEVGGAHLVLSKHEILIFHIKMWRDVSLNYCEKRSTFSTPLG